MLLIQEWSLNTVSGFISSPCDQSCLRPCKQESSVRQKLKSARRDSPGGGPGQTMSSSPHLALNTGAVLARLLSYLPTQGNTKREEERDAMRELYVLYRNNVM